jgi:hypothetical protein
MIFSIELKMTRTMKKGQSRKKVKRTMTGIVGKTIEQVETTGTVVAAKMVAGAEMAAALVGTLVGLLAGVLAGAGAMKLAEAEPFVPWEGKEESGRYT